jgi:Amt family ammonium transporter
MIPGLALFYGAMTRAKSTLNMIMMVMSAMLLTAIVWSLWGYSLASGTSIGGFFGNPGDFFGLKGVDAGPSLLVAGYGATFAMITTGLIAGAVAERFKFAAWVIFVPLWATLVYFPLAHMVWGGGLLSDKGAIGGALGAALDFAGGTVVHISAGTAALVLVLLTGPRIGFGQDRSQRPHNLPIVMLASGILWFGWFGFNSGASTTIETASLTWVNTLLAPAAAGLGWIAFERIRHGKPTSLGAASGIVAGLVAITPACATVSPMGAIIIGIISGVASAWAVGLKYGLKFDDSLDVVGVHLVSGIIGTLAIGFLGTGAGDTRAGLFYGGGLAQLLAQFVSVLVAIALSGIVTLILGLILKHTIGLRVSAEDEAAGLDTTEHAESAYELSQFPMGQVGSLSAATAHSGFGSNPLGGEAVGSTVSASAGQTTGRRAAETTTPAAHFETLSTGATP